MDMKHKDFSKVPIVWRPDENSAKTMKKLMKHIQDKYHAKFEDYWDFYQWSVDHVPEFWGEMWDFTGVICSKKYNQVIDMSIPMENSPKWFEGAEMNFAENLLKYRDDEIALILAGEKRESGKMTRAELYKEAEICAAAFRKCGLRKNDVVMCYMSNRKEAVVGMLAAASIGAIWTGTLPQMGHEAVINRVSQVNPKILLTVDSFFFNGIEVEMLEKVEKIAKGLSSLEKVIIVRTKAESKEEDISRIRNSCFLDDFLETGREEDGSVPPMQFEQVPISHPVFINFTSGTTGLPKTIVHGSAMLLTIYRDYNLHLDMQPGDVFLSLSPVGWASWCIFTTLLYSGVTLLLFEGMPFFTTPRSVWELVDEHKISHLFLTAAVLDELEKRNSVPTKKHHLTSLRLIVSGSSVVKQKSYDFIYQKLKLPVLFGSFYGCTEVMGTLFMTDFSVPAYKGETTVPALATAIECLDEETGKLVFGEMGELVLSKHYPAMMEGLWGDHDGSQFREKYFTKYPGKFFIGDNGILNPFTKGLIVCGRCDDTLKQRGCRFGCSEIYNVVGHFPEVYDSLCVAQYRKDREEERAVLFLKMREGHRFNDSLVRRIRERIAEDLTPRHVPDLILETAEIPVNENGKKMEITVKKIINDMVCNNDAIANPESLQCYRNRPELQGF